MHIRLEFPFELFLLSLNFSRGSNTLQRESFFKFSTPLKSRRTRSKDRWKNSNCAFYRISDAQPSDIERETFEAVQRVLKNSESILEEIQCYKGAGKEIREAISAPTEECQRKAYLTVAPLVAKLKKFYEFSLELGEWYFRINFNTNWFECY